MYLIIVAAISGFCVACVLTPPAVHALLEPVTEAGRICVYPNCDSGCEACEEVKEDTEEASDSVPEEEDPDSSLDDEVGEDEREGADDKPTIRLPDIVVEGERLDGADDDGSYSTTAGGSTGDDNASDTTATAERCDDSETLFRNPIKYCSITEFVLAVIRGLTLLLIPVVTLAIVYIGFQLVLTGSQKSAEYAEKKKQLAWTLIGLFLLLAAQGIITVIQNTVGEFLGPEHAEVLETSKDPTPPGQ